MGHKGQRPFSCRIGLHVWLQTEHEEITNPKLGPFDPRSDAARTHKHAMKICCKCGKKEEYHYDY